MLRDKSHGMGWIHRCTSKNCRARVPVHHSHPIFSCAWGNAKVDLCDQVAILQCAINNISQVTCHILTGLGRDTSGRIYTKFDEVVAQHIEKTEDAIVHGGENYWVDVEADECDVRRNLDRAGAVLHAPKRVIWLTLLYCSATRTNPALISPHPH